MPNDPAPLRVGTRLALGFDIPCHRCKMTGEIRAPKMSKAELEQRRRENLTRAAHGQEPLPRPPSKAPCPLCRGRGVLPRGTAPIDTGDPIPWEL